MDKPIFELNEEYKKMWNSLGRDNILMGMLGMLGIGLVNVWLSDFSNIHDILESLLLVLIGIFFLIFLPYYFALSLNMPGLYEDGISPPSNPMPWKYRKGLFIPFKDIKKIELLHPWNLRGMPRVPPIFVIETDYSNPKKPFKVHFYELSAFFDKNLEKYDNIRMKLYYELLLRVKEIIDENPGIERIPREKYEDILSKYPESTLKVAGVRN